MCTASPNSCLRASHCTLDAICQHPGRATRGSPSFEPYVDRRALNSHDPDIYHFDSIKAELHQGVLKSLFHFYCINEGFDLGSSLLGRSEIL